ncbi:hypothetical protein, partial [Actinomadura darangshiensis]|uniref:hypothetical protein n=1 Tax=Actinomadura darangshiensis TaxID=705336 RepID=UPI001A9DAAA9
PAPMDACLCLAVLFALILLGVAAAGRRPLRSLSPRIGWTLAPPADAAPAPSFAPALQVLRL